MNVKNKENINVNLSNDLFASLKEFISANKSFGPQEVPHGLFKKFIVNTVYYKGGYLYF